MSGASEDFAALVAAGDRCELARATLEVARIAYPGLDPRPSLARLERLAAGVRPRLAAASRSAQAATELAAYLFVECGFRGNEKDYYDPRNSFLNDVLERRTGIPISLAVVLLEVGARAGLRLEGVGFPGHFLVRVAGTEGPILLDPFFGGRAVSREELLARYRATLGARGRRVASVPRRALARTGPREILARMLRNLLRIYLERGDAGHALRAVDLLLVLDPDSTAELRVRGLLYEQVECYAAALADLRRYLELSPDARDADAIRGRMAKLSRAATLH
jgi:regulator of sirC expression with transglutaminase-like and TPR domain